MCPAERHLVPRQNVCLSKLDLLPLQSLRQEHEDRHPSRIRDIHQEDQNSASSAQRAGDRKLTGAARLCVLSVPEHHLQFLEVHLCPPGGGENMQQPRCLLREQLWSRTPASGLECFCLFLLFHLQKEEPLFSAVGPLYNIPVYARQDFSQSFSDLDGVVRQEMEVESSSSSGSQTPDCDKMAEFTGLPGTFVCGEVSVLADVHLQPGQKSRSKNGVSKSIVTKINANKAWPHTTLLPVLLIYLFLVGVLVLSSCYMALKMAALEHRLNAALTTWDRVHGGNTASPQDTEVFGELSTSLIKLEKIQRNLQKLLDET
ncbi:GRAM domain-containing protein 2B-like isoform X3 [Stigmatopora argus]